MPTPNLRRLGELGLCLVDRLEGRGGLLAAEDGVDAVGGLVDALGHGESHVSVGRIVSVHDMRVVGLVEQQVDKAGILVREAVVVLTPNMARQQNVEAADGARHGISRLVASSHLQCWLTMESTTWTKLS